MTMKNNKKKKKNNQQSSLSRKKSSSSSAAAASPPLADSSSSSSCEKTEGAAGDGIHNAQDKAFLAALSSSNNDSKKNRTTTATTTNTITSSTIPPIETTAAKGHGNNRHSNQNSHNSHNHNNYNSHNSHKKHKKQPWRNPFRRDPFSEFIQSRLGTAFAIFLIALLCDIFLAKPILHQKGLTEVQLLQEIMQKTTGVNLENTLRFINASIPIGGGGGGVPDPKLRPGYTLAQQGATAKYPVVLIPGFITSGLELWQGEDCAKRHFRQRLWGSLPIFVQSFFTDMKCWSRHLALDPLTGGDPESIRLRSAQGFEAADYFMSTYWVWDKIIENLSEVGYDSSNMIMMSYDWRLSFDTLERRDGYLTKLKMNIEAMVKTTGTKVVIASHSMGSQIVLYFFKWVTTEEEYGGGGGGVDWVEKHCAKFVNIAGPLLGVPKAVPALLSGEMKDTAALLGPMGNMVERVFGKKDRKELWTTWGSLWEMLPKGGDEIWGSPFDIITAQYDPPLTESSELSERLCHNVLSMQDDSETTTTKTTPKTTTTTTTDEFCQQPEKAQVVSHAPNVVIDPRHSYRDDPSNTKSFFITFTQDAPKDCAADREGVNFQQSIDSCDNIVNKKLDTMDRNWSITESIEFLRKSGGGYGHNLHASKSITPRPDSDTWNNPLVTPLPNAPSMKIYCLYGVGIETERAYFYRRLDPPLQNNDDEMNFPFVLDGTMNDPENHIHFGSKSSDGDVSVPLISLGYLCANKWKTSKQLNPSDIHVVTREYKHREEFQVNDPMRGGPYSSDHVDILGNVDAMTDLIKVVTDHEVDQIMQDKIVSDIESISNKINDVTEIRKHI